MTTAVIAAPTAVEQYAARGRMIAAGLMALQRGIADGKLGAEDKKSLEDLERFLRDGDQYLAIVTPNAQLREFFQGAQFPHCLRNLGALRRGKAVNRTFLTQMLEMGQIMIEVHLLRLQPEEEFPY